MNLGVHDFDLAAYLARSPLQPLDATAGGPGPEGEAREDADCEARADVLARTDSGVPVRILLDQRPSDGARRRAITVTTHTHLWEGDLLAPSLVRTCRASGVRDAIPLDTEEPLLAQALSFSAIIRGGAAPARAGGCAASSEIATGLEGMRALLVAEGARRALSSRARPWGKLGVLPPV